MNPLRKVRSVSQFRELLARWLLFTAVFAALAFLVLQARWPVMPEIRYPPGERNSPGRAGGGARS